MHLKSSEQIADLFTKGLGNTCFVCLRDRLMGWVKADSSLHEEEETKSKQSNAEDDGSKSNGLKGRVGIQTPIGSENREGNRTLSNGRGKPGARAQDPRSKKQRNQRRSKKKS